MLIESLVDIELYEMNTNGVTRGSPTPLDSGKTGLYTCNCTIKTQTKQNL